MQQQGREAAHLAEIHDHALVDLLPQVGAEDLNERDLECGNLPVHEDASQVQLHLEPHVHLGGDTQVNGVTTSITS